MSRFGRKGSGATALAAIAAATLLAFAAAGLPGAPAVADNHAVPRKGQEIEMPTAAGGYDGPKQRAEVSQDDVAAEVARVTAEIRRNTAPYRSVGGGFRKEVDKLAKLGAPAVPALTEALGEPGDENGLVRETVAKAFYKMGKSADVFRKMGADARPAMLALLVALRDDFDDTSMNASMALLYFGAPAVPHLIEALSDDVYWVRWRAAWVLGRMAPPPVEAVPALTRALNDENRSVRQLGAQALGNIGPAAKSAAPGLEMLRDDKVKSVREAAAKALAQITKRE